VNLATGSFGVVAGTSLAAGSAAACGPTVGVACAGVPVGAYIAGASYNQAQAGSQDLFGPYSSKQGALVIASFNPNTYPGENSPLWNLGVKGLETAVSATISKWVLGSGTSKPKPGETSVNGAAGLGNTGKTSDALLPEADFAGRGTVRPDLVEHLTDSAKKGKQINGGHDMNSFNATLNQAGGKVLSKVEKAPGIYEVEYQLPNSSKSFPKTIYDPAMYPNMPNMVNEAAAKGLYQYHKTGLVEQTVVLNGIKFTVNVKFPKGQPAITTVYPSGVVK
jgi:hypothetical protein